MRITFLVVFLSLFALSAQAGSQWTMADAKTILQAVSKDPAPIKILNVWATWCPPCRKELPEFIKFSTLHPKIPVYFVSGNDASERKQAEAFMASLGAHQNLYQLNHVDEHELQTFGPQWAGALPGTFLYDAHGKLLKFWVGETSAKRLAERIKALDPGALKR